MEEIQIKEIIRVLIFSFSDGPGTPDWAEKNDIYQSYGDHQNQYFVSWEIYKESDECFMERKKGKKVPTSSTVCASFCAEPVDICIDLKKM